VACEESHTNAIQRAQHCDCMPPKIYVVNSSRCKHLDELTTPPFYNSPFYPQVNEVASRLVKDRLQGDVLVILSRTVPWLATLDSAQLYTSEQLLLIARRNSPTALEASAPNQPPIKALLTILGSSSLPTQLRAQHDHSTCGDSCRHLSYLPRHPVLLKSTRDRDPPIKPKLSLESGNDVGPDNAKPRLAPALVEQRISDVQMEIPKDPPSVCVTALDTTVVHLPTDESSTDMVSTNSLESSVVHHGATTSMGSLYHAPKRHSVDYYSASTGVPVLEFEFPMTSDAPSMCVDCIQHTMPSTAARRSTGQAPMSLHNS
jgi:hypothetical protein